MPADPNRVRDVFLAAVELRPDRRLDYLADACGGDAELRAEVDRLLAAHADPDSLLEPPPPHPPDATGAFAPAAGTVDLPSDTSPTGTYGPDARRPNSMPTGDFAPDGAAGTAARYERPTPTASGTVIAGRYTLVEVIGEGGMGSVYLANQTEPVKRRVAVKLIKSGMDSKAVLARFDAERQALALMDHPNIARIYDGGVTDRGQPFFVMELVQGVPLTEYCDARRLSVGARLELFVSVCQAVQHAHQKGIIHRDLKPGNVLVTEVDGRPTPKVIDFGVAKATEQKLTDMSFADTGAIVGTPAYMSPEQADPSSMDIDTRTDVYSLGVILYELLTGSPPIEAKQFRRGAILEMLRMVREVDPPKPSTRVSTSDALPSIAATRGIEPAQLKRALHGDLDWIVMKTLEKDRSRRYETATGLAADVRRHLAHEPVVAAPPSRAYRLRKFVRKNRGPVVAAGLVLLALVGGVIGTTLGLIEARTARKAETERAESEKRERQRAEQAEAEARRRAAELKLVSDFQAEMLDNIDLNEAGKGLTADVAALFAASLVEAGVPAAEREARVKAFQDHWGRVNAADAARKLIDRTILQPAVAAIDKQFAGQPLAEAQVRQALASVYALLSLFEPALPIQERALAIRRTLLGSEHPDTIHSLGQMGILHWFRGKYADAEPFLREEVDLARRVLGGRSELTADANNHLALLLQSQSKNTEAENHLREALEIRRRVKGDADPTTVVAINNFGRWLESQGRFAEAETQLAEAVRLTRLHLEEDSEQAALTPAGLGRVLALQGRLAEAEPILRASLALTRRRLGEEHVMTCTITRWLCEVLLGLGRHAEAGQLLGKERSITTRVRGQDHVDVLFSESLRVRLQLDQGKLAEADALTRDILERTRRVWGENHATTRRAVRQRGQVLVAQGAFAEALVLLAPAEGPTRKTSVNDNAYHLARLLVPLGQARGGLARQPAEFAAAEANLLEAHAIYRKTPGPFPQDLRDCVRALVDLYAAWEKAEPGKGYAAKGEGWKKRLPANPVPPPGQE